MKRNKMQLLHPTATAPAPHSIINEMKKKPKMMRLRSRTRPLFDSCCMNGTIWEGDADVTFVCADKQKVTGHKLILAHSSSFFMNVFADQKPNKMTTVIVPDVSAAVMKALVHLAYREEVQISKNLAKDLAESLRTFGMSPNLFRYDGGEEILTVVAEQDRLYMEKVQHENELMTRGQQKQTAAPLNDSNYNGSSPKQSRKHAINNQQSGGSYSETISVENTVEEVLEYPSTDNDESRQLVQQWMANLGKDINNFPANAYKSDGHAPQKPKARLSIPVSVNQPKQLPNLPKKRSWSTDDCSVCSKTFNNSEQLNWHVQRHVGRGIFKCIVCAHLYETARTVYDHELEVHRNVKDRKGNMIPPPPAECEDGDDEVEMSASTNANSRKRKLIPRQGFDGDDVVEFEQTATATTKNTAEVKKMCVKKRIVNPQRYPTRKVVKVQDDSLSTISGHSSSGSEAFVYMCRCKHLERSFTSARKHYKTCSRGRETTFIESVKKFEQGSQKDVLCPLCHTAWLNTKAFLIHCGTEHASYRKGITYNETIDALNCKTCMNNYKTPEDFHRHVKIKGCKPRPGITSKPKPKRKCSESSDQSPPMPHLVRAKSISKDDIFDDVREKRMAAASKTMGHGTATAPRSARLANRFAREADPATAAATVPVTAPVTAPVISAPTITSVTAPTIAPVAAPTIAPVTVPVTANVTGPTPQSDGFRAINCIICGEETGNIGHHLKSNHRIIKGSIKRINFDLLSCVECDTSFGIGDLMNHSEKCAAGTEKDDKSTSITEPSMGSFVPVVVTDSIGNSPIDQSDIPVKNFFTLENYENSLRCGVCRKVHKKQSEAAKCLLGHRIWRCPLCFNTYKKNEDFTQHVKEFHTKSKSQLIRCHTCPKSFHTLNLVASHMATIHWPQVHDKSKVTDSSKIAHGTLTSEDAASIVTSTNNVGDKTAEKEIEIIDLEEIQDSASNSTEHESKVSTEKKEEEHDEDDNGLVIDEDAPVNTSDNQDVSNSTEGEDELTTDTFSDMNSTNTTNKETDEEMEISASNLGAEVPTDETDTRRVES